MEFNRIYFGDSCQVLLGLPDKTVQCVVTSPEYYGNSRWKTSSLESYLEIQRNVFSECFRVLKEDGTIFININDLFVQKEKQYLNVPAKFDLLLRDIGFVQPQPPIIWMKDTALSNKGRLQDIWEYVFIYSKSYSPKFDKEAIQVPSKYDKNRRLDKTGLATKSCPNVWYINKVFADGRFHIKEHSCPFPEQLVRNCLLLATDEGDVVLDPYSGSGTTCYVAKSMGRSFLGIEIDPAYYKDSLKNMELGKSVVSIKEEGKTSRLRTIFDIGDNHSGKGKSNQ